MVDGQLPEHGAVDGARHLNQHGHELLFGDEYGVVDLEICLFGGVTALQRLARGRIGVWVGAGFHTRLVTLESTFGRVGVLIAYMHLPACVHHLTAHHLKVHADTARGLARVSVPQGAVANLRHQRGHGFHRTHLAGRVGQIEPADGGVDHEIIQRFGPGDQRAHCLVASLDAQVARVEIVVGHGHEGLGEEGRIKAEGMQRGFLAGGVTIEREHDARAQRLVLDLQRPDQLDRTQRIVGDQAAHNLGVLGAERRAARGDGGVDAGQMHGHHVRIAFDDHHLPLLDDGGFGQIDAVKHLGFAVELRIRRVDVFGGDLVVLIQLARAEAERAAGRIADGPGHSAAEIVIDAALALTGQARVEDFLLRKPLGGQVAHKIIPTLGRVAATETFAVGLGEVAASEQLAGGQCFLGQNLGDEEALGFLAGFQQSGALGAGVLAVRAVAAVLVVQLDMVLVGEQFHGFAEVDVFGLFDVFEYVATQAAAEAVPHAE